MSNVFTRNLQHSSPPWRLADPEHRGRIINQLDQVVATVPKAGAVDWQTRTANLKEALITAAAVLDSHGIPPSDDLIDLLNVCRPGAPRILTVSERQQPPSTG